MTLTGSINMTKLFEASKAGTISTWTTQNGEKMANIALFMNDHPDQYGNDATIKCQGIKDQPDPKVYIGNLKKAGAKQEAATETSGSEELPF
jgi:hypothetical protein